MFVSSGRAQTLNCSTISGASEYGTDISVCQMPDESSLRCTQDKGGLSYCKVEHPNGFVSSTNQGSGAGQALGMLIAWMIHTHQQHVSDRAISDASSTVLLTMKHTMHLTDLSALLDRLAPYLPPDQREPMVRMSEGLADQSSAFSGAVSNFSANWNDAGRSSFLREAKNMHKLYDSGLVAVCTARSASQVLTGKLDTVRANLATTVLEGLDAVRADEMLLGPECDSERAIKLLQKQQSRAASLSK
jgi:hypothetical protein